MDAGMSTDKEIGYDMLPWKKRRPTLDATEVLCGST